MGRGTKDIIVDGVKYSTTKYSPTKGLRLLTRLSKLLGPSIGELMSAGGLDGQVGDTIKDAVTLLVDRLDEDQLLDLTEQILEGTQIYADGGNRKIIFDNDFVGRYGHLFNLIREILTFQYDDFLGVLAGARQGFAARREPDIKAV